MTRLRGFRLWLAITGGGFAIAAVAAVLIWRGDILEALLDPEVPYAVYKPPAAPDYAKASAWALLPGPPSGKAPAADVFFVHPTTFDGGKDWNGPILDRKAARELDRVMLPNYAAPFAGAGRVFAPRYRQASLYTSLTMFDDAIQARTFAYGDVARAFAFFQDRLSHGRPFVVVGVGQGGVLAARLLSDAVLPRADVKARLVAAYLIETVVPADEHGPAAPLPACSNRDQAGCLTAWVSAPRGDFVRSMKILARTVVWNGRGLLVGLEGRDALCVNPLLGATSGVYAPPRLNLGAANATGLEWGARPGVRVRQVGAQCVGGVLRVTRPRSASLRPSGSWANRLKAPGYNLFYADLETDAERRVAAMINPPR